ncbi:hypothetical protein GCM10027596_26650 [Nocardioides korecus]
MELVAEQPLSIAQTATLTHGFTLADVERAARIAVSKHVFSCGLLEDEERYNSAWHGIAVHLYECGCGWDEQQCNRTGGVIFRDLLFAGIHGIDEALNAAGHHHGRPRGGAVGTAPNFVRYWGSEPPAYTLPSRRPKYRESDADFVSQICNRFLLREALAVLTADQYDAIATLAAFDNDREAAADALGLSATTYSGRVARARKLMVEVWFNGQPELAPPVVDPVTQCKRGHARDEHGYQRGKGGASKWGCRECDRITGRERARRYRAEASAARVLASEDDVA